MRLTSCSAGRVFEPTGIYAEFQLSLMEIYELVASPLSKDATGTGQHIMSPQRLKDGSPYSSANLQAKLGLDRLVIQYSTGKEMMRGT